MQKFAVIDVGSNSVRLMFVADGNVLYKALNTTRLGEGLANSAVLSSAAIERTAQAVAAFYFRAKNEGAEAVFAFATAAARSAQNGADFVQRVRELCPLSVEIISGEEEAEIGILGALGNADGGVVDVGGASTEIVVRKGGSFAYKKSINVGVVRLKDRCGRDRASLEAVANAEVGAFGEIPKDVEYFAIGGTATTLAAQKLGLKEYTSDAVTGAKLRLADLEALSEKFSSLSLEEVAALPCMPKGRADVITGGAVWLKTLLERLGLSEITVSDRDNLEGYAVKRGYME